MIDVACNITVFDIRSTRRKHQSSTDGLPPLPSFPATQTSSRLSTTHQPFPHTHATVETHQLTIIAALFSAMKGNSPQTLQKPTSKIHHCRIFTLYRETCGLVHGPGRQSDQRVAGPAPAQSDVAGQRSSASGEGNPGALFFRGMVLSAALHGKKTFPNFFFLFPPLFCSSPSQPASASVICAAAPW